MVSFDDVWRPIACPWISPYHCPSRIVLDVKSKFIRRENVAPPLWCPTAMFTGPIQPRSDVRWGQRHTNNRCRANSPPSCSLRDTVWRDMSLPAAAESCDAICRAVSVIWRLAHFNR
ncbi:hypothetical protein AVEN_93494-1 [Araneus ventricosus]|uniref:Uncharacterized protein n=1 Tax=Araneus ventricosus TaxID=182803 RepID=A0A4Y2APM7_ARAVE|nr:hypothetical protein AVEN_93494-1 [Araneus ventricosus]